VGVENASKRKEKKKTAVIKQKRGGVYSKNKSQKPRISRKPRVVQANITTLKFQGKMKKDKRLHFGPSGKT